MAVLSPGASAARTRIPTAPGALPLLGHSVSLLRDPLTFLLGLPEHGDLVRLRIGTGDVYVVCTPELTYELLHDPRAFDKGGFFFDRLRELTGNNVASCPHAEHAAHRRRVQPIFRKDRMPGYGRTIVDQATTVLDTWRPDQSIDAFPDMLRIGAGCAAALVFGAGFTPDALEHTISDITLYVKGIFTRMFLPPALARIPLPANRRYQAVRTRLRHAVSDMIDRNRTAGGAIGGDLLTALLESAPATPDSRTDLVDELILMLMAGTESTATTLAWTLYELARDPALQRRVQVEIDTVVGAHTPAHAHIEHLHLTGRVLTETLRKYPAAWILSRVTTTEASLGGHRIPAGATIVFSPYLLHHRADVFPDPERFDTDRWLPHNVCPSSRKALVPFGGGTRKCAGDGFAMSEAALVLASIMSRWTVEPVPHSTVRLAAYGALQPEGLRLRTVAR
ncbi:cytochrome P450 [Nocardia sp. NPDC004582]